MKYLMLLVVLFLSGCADSYVTITKLDASGQYVPFVNAVTSGCIVTMKGDPANLIVKYTDAECVVEYGNK